MDDARPTRKTISTVSISFILPSNLFLQVTKGNKSVDQLASGSMHVEYHVHVN